MFHLNLGAGKTELNYYPKTVNIQILLRFFDGYCTL